jgi:hypothetical protein
MQKYGVPLSIELQRAPESGTPGVPGTYETIATFGAGPQAHLDAYRLMRKDSGSSQRLYFYRARTVAPGLTSSAWLPATSPWISGVPKEFFGSNPVSPVPAYPVVIVSQEQPPDSPGNVSIRLKGAPDHPDTNIYYKYVGLTDAIPPKSRDTSVWTPYSHDPNDQAVGECSNFAGTPFTSSEVLDFTPSGAAATLLESDESTFVKWELTSGVPQVGDEIEGATSGATCDLDAFLPFTLNRDSSVNKRLVTWADLNGIFGPFTIVEVRPNEQAEIESSDVSQDGNGASTDVPVTRSVEVDSHTVEVEVFRKKDAWPTTDGTQSGNLDPDYLRGSIDNGDNWEFTDGGHSGDYRQNDVVYDIFVPIDANGNAGKNTTTDRNRWEYSYTVTGAPTDPYFNTSDRVEGQTGTSCSVGNRRQAKVDYTATGMDNTYQFELYQRIDAGGWNLVSTHLWSTTSTGMQDLMTYFQKPNPVKLVDLQIRIYLIAGHVLKDSRTHNDTRTYEGQICPV